MRGLFLTVTALVFLTSPSAMPLPRALETAHLLGRGLPSGVSPVELSDELYALGWSRANAFAILERRTLRNSREVRFRVLDLITDNTLFETVWDDWGSESAKTAWWGRHEKEADEIFARFSLLPTTWQLGVFPLILDNEFYTLALRSFRSTRDPLWIDRWEVYVHSTGRGLKQVTERSGYWRWAALLGFLPSPFENRVALILLVQPTGWLGKDEPLRFVVAGLSLKAGFSTP